MRFVQSGMSIDLGQGRSRIRAPASLGQAAQVVPLAHGCSQVPQDVVGGSRHGNENPA